jgi:hypothetical protein
LLSFLLIRRVHGQRGWFTASTAFANPAVTIAGTFSDTFTGIRSRGSCANGPKDLRDYERVAARYPLEGSKVFDHSALSAVSRRVTVNCSVVPLTAT